MVCMFEQLRVFGCFRDKALRNEIQGNKQSGDSLPLPPGSSGGLVLTTLTGISLVKVSLKLTLLGAADVKEDFGLTDEWRRGWF